MSSEWSGRYADGKELENECGEDDGGGREGRGARKERSGRGRQMW